MTRDEFDQHCASFPATTHVVQWGNASVWKIGGKIFAICSGPNISLKCSDLAYELLPEREGIRPAPYLARAKWVEISPGAMDEEELKSHLQIAYRIIAGKLTKSVRAEWGLSG